MQAHLVLVCTPARHLLYRAKYQYSDYCTATAFRVTLRRFNNTGTRGTACAYHRAMTSLYSLVLILWRKEIATTLLNFVLRIRSHIWWA